MILRKRSGEEACLFQRSDENCGISFRDRRILKIAPVFGRELLTDRVQ
jgi:hypothetical protein